MMSLFVINESGHPLAYATEGACGLDLRACVGEPRLMRPGQRWKFDTGISAEIPDGMVGLVQGRSGKALNDGLHVFTGTIDRDYRGRIGVICVNLGSEDIKILPGDRIAQLVVVAAPRLQVVEVSALSPTDRGSSGFGSTGR